MITAEEAREISFDKIIEKTNKKYALNILEGIDHYIKKSAQKGECSFKFSMSSLNSGTKKLVKEELLRYGYNISSDPEKKIFTIYWGKVI